MKKRNIFICLMFALLMCFSLNFSDGAKKAFAEDASNEITITFDSAGGKCSTRTMTIQSGESIAELPTAEFAGNIFLGWTNGTDFISSSTTFTENATLTASFIKKIFSYDISFSNNKFKTTGKTADSTYNYTLSSDSETLESALELISADLVSTATETTINLNDLTLTQNLNLSFQKVILTGTLNLDKFSICYTAPVAGSSTIALNNLTLTANSSQDMLKLQGSNSSTVRISNTTFNSSSLDNNFAIKLEKPIHKLSFSNSLSYSTKFLYNFDYENPNNPRVQKLAEFASSFNLTSPSKIAITIPYSADGQPILQTYLLSSSFEFVPNQTNFNSLVQEDLTHKNKYIYASTNFNISFDENGADIVEAFTTTNLNFNINTNQPFPTELNFKKEHFYLDGFVGKLNYNSVDYYFDKTALQAYIDAGSDDTKIPTIFYTQIPAPESESIGFTYYKYSTSNSDLNFLATNLMLKQNQTPTFVAIWKHIIYSITFNENGGQEVSDLTGIFDSSVSLQNTSKPGYDFVGWFGSAELAETANQADIVSISKMPDTNTTLFAGWIIRSNKLFIHKNNLSETIELNVQFDSLISTINELNPSSFSKTGYSFAGWFTDESLTTELDENQTMPDSSFSVYAKWTINEYTITLYLNHISDDSIYKTATKEYKSDVTDLFSEIPSFIGYTFAGWFTDENGRYPYTNFPEMMPAENITLYAIWNEIEYFLNIYYPAIGQEDRKVKHYNEDLGLITPEYPGFVFAGWFLDEDFTMPLTATKMPNENLSVYAKFDNKKIISLDIDSQSFTVSENKGFVLDSNIDGFVIEYLVAGEWTTTVPTEKGTYDVKISRNEDAIYNAYSKVFESAYSITANLVDISIYSLILYCIAGFELLCAIIVLFLRKQRKTYLTYAIAFPFGVVSTSQFVNLVVSLTLAVFGFVLLVMQIVKLKKVNNEISKISTENKEYTPPDVSENQNIAKKVEILLQQHGFVSADEQDENLDELDESKTEKDSNNNNDYLSFNSKKDKED